MSVKLVCEQRSSTWKPLFSAITSSWV